MILWLQSTDCDGRGSCSSGQDLNVMDRARKRSWVVSESQGPVAEKSVDNNEKWAVMKGTGAGGKSSPDAKAKGATN